jgi:hypothetical protein
MGAFRVSLSFFLEMRSNFTKTAESSLAVRVSTSTRQLDSSSEADFTVLIILSFSIREISLVKVASA